MKKVLSLSALLLIIVFTFVSCHDNLEPTIQTIYAESINARIKGNLDLPESGKVSASDIWIKVSCNGDTVSIVKANEDGSFVISGLREDEKYDVLFTTEKPEIANSKDIARGADSTTGYGGWLSNVTASINEGHNVGAVTISPLGTIKGKATLDGEAEHYDILIYIPGTSFSAYTSADGSFFMYNVPEGTYSVRITYLKSGFGSELCDNVAVRGSKTDKEEHPVTQLDDVVLYHDLGIIEGKVLLDSDNDYSGISIMAKKNDGTKTYTSNTDISGSYHIDDIKPGLYTLYISKSGFDTIVIENLEVAPAATKIVPVQTLSSGVRYASGKVQLEGKTDYSGALITATNTTDTTLIYSAISNVDGDYSLVNMKPGQYRIVITANNYNTKTLGVVSILKDAIVNLEEAEMTIIRGTILGSATLEGRATNSGIKAELMKGTDVYSTTYTDESGLYVFNVPQGNYSGVRLTCENFKSVSIAQDIALIANDQVIIGQNADMIATHVPVVRGRLTVKGLLSMDYSGIAVTLIENGMTTITDEDGYWSFAKVPVGHYTLKFERENTNVVTMAMDVVAAAEKNVGTIELIPNAASIEGHATLNGLTDYSGITVRATAEGMAELTTKTNAAGYFYIGNVVTTETYTVHFEKTGWISQTREVSGLEDLSINDITAGNPVILMDTTAPVLDSISVTVGNSELDGRKLNVYINATEEGSGIDKIYVNTNNDFTDIDPISYANPLNYYVEDVEGDYTLYVKVEDKAGNQSSILNRPFSITDYKTVVSSVILDNEDGVEDGIVTWTKAKSPYYVTSNLVIDKNTMLIIEPGVNVQIAGAYFIQVEGVLKVNGTEIDNVFFYGVGDGEDRWTGINVVNENGSIINHTSITGMERGLVGHIDVYDSFLAASASGYAMDRYSGNAHRNTIVGGISVSESTLLYNSIDATSGIIASSVFAENTIKGNSLALYRTYCDNNNFSSVAVQIESASAINSSFSGSSLQIGYGIIYKCELNGCIFPSFSYGTIICSNIIDCGKLSTETEVKSFGRIKLTNNYWGVNNTAELIANGINSNLSFIEDYYDDFNVTKADLSGYRTTEIIDAGYFGITECVPQYSIGDTGPAGGIIFYDKGYYSDGWRYLEAAPNDLPNKSGNIVFGYCRKSDNGINLGSGTSQEIGFGKINTKMLVDDMGDEAYSEGSGSAKTNSYIAKLCDSYSYGGYSDWFLPSYDELNLMYVNLKESGLGAFANEYYWSSSEYWNDNSYILIQDFSNGSRNSCYERNWPTYYSYKLRIRLIRSF